MFEKSVFFVLLGCPFFVMLCFNPTRLHTQFSFSHSFHQFKGKQTFDIKHKTYTVDTEKNFLELQKQNIRTRIVFPGTKWCGVGFTAKFFDDLGRNYETDRCCREHDLCPKYIPAGSVKYGLWNLAVGTKSHCSCDERLYNCLKKMFSTVCFKKSHLLIGCAKRTRGRCIEYYVDETSPKIYQWFENPKF